MSEAHSWRVRTTWSGSTGVGYDRYSRGHESAPDELAPLAMSADPAFLGDPERYNPEQLLVMAASSCQLLSFLALAAGADIDVLDYRDDVTATMPPAHRMAITEITLRPTFSVTSASRLDRIERTLRRAHDQCFIANSLRSSITIEATVLVDGEVAARHVLCDDQPSSSR